MIDSCFRQSAFISVSIFQEYSYLGFLSRKQNFGPLFYTFAESSMFHSLPNGSLFRSYPKKGIHPEFPQTQKPFQSASGTFYSGSSVSSISSLRCGGNVITVWQTRREGKNRKQFRCGRHPFRANLPSAQDLRRLKSGIYSRACVTRKIPSANV